MKFSTMIPVNRNDGLPLHTGEFSALVRLFWDAFGGCTVDAIADGYWKDDTGKLFVDKVRRLTVVVENNSQANLDYARLLVRRVGVQLGQKTMYFEHNASLYIDVEFIDIDPEEDFTAIPESQIEENDTPSSCWECTNDQQEESVCQSCPHSSMPTGE